MLNWLRRLLSIPEPEYICPGCEAHQHHISRLIRENEQLLDYILTPKGLETQYPNPTREEEPEAIQPRIIPWQVRKQMLEREDRQKAELLRKSSEERKQAIEELENRLNVKPLVVPNGEVDVQSSTVQADGGFNQQEEVSSQRKG